MDNVHSFLIDRNPVSSRIRYSSQRHQIHIVKLLNKLGSWRGFGKRMSTSKPCSIQELIKPKFDEVLNLITEREDGMKIEMQNFAKVCIVLKNEVDSLKCSKSQMDIVKRSLEVELGRSQRRCEELEERLAEMEEMNEKLWAEKLEVEEKLEKSGRKSENGEERELRMGERLGFEPSPPEISPNSKKRSEKLDVEEKLERSGDQPRLRVNVDLVGTMNKSAQYFAKNGEVKVAAGDGDASKKGAKCRVYVTRSCDLSIITKIKNFLDKRNLEIFEKSCFGHFLKIKHLRYQGRLVLQLLLHMDMDASNKEKLVFKINNSNFEFGRDDFHRVTGLHFGTSEALPVKEGAFQLKNVEKVLLKVSRNHKGGGKMTLKLAMLYFVYGTLLASNPRKKKPEYLDLIEDLHKYNTYPWGRVAYDYLVSSIFNVRKRMDGLKFTHKIKMIQIHGFIYALQIWAYESMPFVAQHCASPADNFEILSPQILRWMPATKLISFYQIKKLFALDDKTRLAEKEQHEFVAEDVIYICDSDEEIPDTPEKNMRGLGDNRKRERSTSRRAGNEERAAAQGNADPDDESLSDSYMNNLVLKLR